MATRLVGPRTWGPLTRDSEGYRECPITHLVEADTGDGPFTVLRTPGLPLPGSSWNFGNDVEIWAYCKQNATVTAHPQIKEGSPTTRWLVQQTFSTKPDAKSCRDQQIENPLLQPPKVSIRPVSGTEEATHDRFGQPILSSSWEMIRGPTVEFPKTWTRIEITQNVASSFQGFELPERLKNCVNASPLWGQPRRCVWLADYSTELNYYGNCFLYYTRRLAFEISAKLLTDELSLVGATALNGGTGYVIGEVLQLSAGGEEVATVRVLSVVSGHVGTVAITSSSVQATAPANPATVLSTSGSGTGATFTLAWQPKVVSGWDKDILDEGTKALDGKWVGRNWVHNLVGGNEPDPMNPMHFKRFHDREGNPCRVILNGSGDPAGVVVGLVGGNKLFVSLEPANTGNALSDSEFWIPVAGPTSPIPRWDFETTYARGNLVLVLDPVLNDTFNIFVATQDPDDGENPLTAGQGGPSPSWLFLRQATSDTDTLPDEGQYDVDTSYIVGDLVHSAGETTAGRIHVEKFTESDFLALGIPLLL